MKINTISPQSNNFLQIISDIAKPPKRLYFKGSLPKDRLTSVAIVGTRRPTTYGKEVTYKLSYDLAKKGIVIVSGLALGTDAIAHKAALDAGGTTLAILASGLNHITPRSNISLAQEILASGGAIISEYQPNIEARDFQFLARNRIVSGLSDAVVVTEAASRSGTLATVNHALDQNKDVFSVPGNITSPMSASCNALLKQGAAPATCAEDILEVIAPELLSPQQTKLFGSNATENSILELIQSGVKDGDELQSRLKINTSELSQALVMMQISGLVRPLGANKWTLK